MADNIFGTNFAKKMISRKQKFNGHISMESNQFCTDLRNVLATKDGDLQTFVGKRRLLPYTITTASETPLVLSVAFVNPAMLQENLSNLFGLSYVILLFCFTRGSFSTEIIICSFNNSALKKCTNAKAFYIVATASAQFFATLI